jgi:hypothetical protein
MMLAGIQEFTNMNFSFRFNIAVSCFNNRYFPNLSQGFLGHRCPLAKVVAFLH